MAPRYEHTLWESLDGKRRTAVTKGALTEPLPEDLRLRLLHPTRLDSRSLAEWRKRHPEAAQLTRPVHAMGHPDAIEVTPVNTDWASTQNPTIIGPLMQKGFHQNELSSEAFQCVLDAFPRDRDGASGQVSPRPPRRELPCTQGQDDGAPSEQKTWAL